VAGLDGAGQTARRLNRNSGQICPRPRPHRGRASFANAQNFREVGLHQSPSERKGEGVPVRRLRVPSHVPSHPQTTAKVRGLSPIAAGFTAETDWLLEEGGFEPLVPLERNWPARPRRPGRRRAVYDSSAEAVMAVEGCDGHQAAASIGVIWTANPRLRRRSMRRWTCLAWARLSK